MSDKQKMRALIRAGQAINDCYDLGITAEEVIAFSKVLITPFDDTESQNENNEKGKEKRDIPPTPPIESKEKPKEIRPFARACEAVEMFTTFFNAFWSEYPVGYKIAKQKCRRALQSRFSAAKDQAAFVNAVLGGLDKWKHCGRWKDGYVCNPYTFIYQERWNDHAPDDNERHEHSFRKVGGVSQTANVKLKGKGLW